LSCAPCSAGVSWLPLQMSQDEEPPEENSICNLGAIGNGTLAALIDTQGKYVFCCMNHFGGDPVFNSLLNNNSEDTGFLDCVLQNFHHAEQKYIPNTAILVTTLFSKTNDVVQIKDFAPRFGHFDRMFRPFQVFRIINRIRGDPMITVRVRPTFDFNSKEAYQTRGSHHIRYCGHKEIWRLTTTASIQRVLEEVPFLVHDPVYMVFGQDESFSSSLSHVSKEFEHKTMKYWKTWCASLCLCVEYQDILVRTAITLGMMQSEEFSGFISSFTFGIPTGPDAPPTRDERLCRLFDECLCLSILREFGMLDICRKFLEFLKNICFLDSEGGPQSTYSHLGQGEVPAEKVPYLAGFHGRGDLTVGGVAPDRGDALPGALCGLLCLGLTHACFDVRLKDLCSPKLIERLESLATTAYEAFQDYAKRPPPPSATAADLASQPSYFDDDLRCYTYGWAAGEEEEHGQQQRDLGAWQYWHPRAHQEVPKLDQPPVHTFTSVLCWCAADRVRRIFAHRDNRAKAEIWGQRAEEMSAVILQRAWSPDRKAFTSFWGGAVVGPSLLRLAEVGIIKANDPRFASTVECFEADAPKVALSLSVENAPQVGGLLQAGEDAWLDSVRSYCMSSNTMLWYAEALRAVGRIDDAKKLFNSITACANDCGLLSQSIDMRTRKLWGNIPHCSTLLSILRVGTRLSMSWRDL